MPSGVVYSWKGYVWFVENATCASVDRRAIPPAAIRVVSFGAGFTPEVEVLLPPLRDAAVPDAARDEPAPSLVHAIEGKTEKRSILRSGSKTQRAAAVHFAVVRSLVPCDGAAPAAAPPLPPPPPEEPPPDESGLPRMFR